MSTYTPSTNFATKDALSPGDPLKIVRGTEINTEFVNISTAVTSINNKLTVTVKDFGAVGDGVTDDSAAITAAITAAKAGTSKTIYFPGGTYLTTSSITLDGTGLTLIGAGGGGNSRSATGSAGVVGTGLNVGATQILGNFNGGAVVRIKSQGCSVMNMTIARSSTAYATAFAVADAGILVSADDLVGYQTARRAYIANVRVMNTNGDGILLANDIVNSLVENCEVNCVKGAGYMVAGGSYIGYTNRAQPGQVLFINNVSCWTGGHGMRVGGGTAEVDGIDIPYRVNCIQMEAFYNCIISANCISSPAIANLFLSGFNHEFSTCAFDGRAEFPSNLPVHAAAVMRGTNISHKSMRLVQCTAPAAYVVAPPAGGGSGSRGIQFENLFVVNTSEGAGYFNPVVDVAAGVRNIEVHCNQPDTASIAAISTLTNRPVNGEWLEEFNGVTLTAKNSQHASGDTNSGLASPSAFSLADNKAGFFQWDDVTRGTALLGGNTSAAQSALVGFRVGALAFVSSLAVGANVNVTTGALTGTTGADGKLTISADTATNRIFIENRLGGAFAYALTFLSCSTNSPGVGIVNDFVNLP